MGESVPKPQTQDVLSLSYLSVCSADSQVTAPGWALIHGNLGGVLASSTWNSCPEPQCLAGASGREILVLSIAAVCSNAINH